MRRPEIVWSTAALLLVVVFAVGKNKNSSWAEPYTNWSRDQVLKLLNDSPWAESQTFQDVIDAANAGLNGEKELFYKFTVRFFSALPVREGYVRMFQILNNYQAMAADQRREFDTRFKRGLDLDVSKTVIVSVEFATNNPDSERDMRQALANARTDTLKQSVYLITEQRGRLDLQEYFPPSSDGTGAKFFFPRTLNGQPVVQPDDKEVRFDFTPPVVNRRLFLTFKIAKMFYQDQLSF